jgi:hypothetical protein
MRDSKNGQLEAWRQGPGHGLRASAGGDFAGDFGGSRRRSDDRTRRMGSWPPAVGTSGGESSIEAPYSRGIWHARPNIRNIIGR